MPSEISILEAELLPARSEEEGSSATLSRRLLQAAGAADRATMLRALVTLDPAAAADWLFHYAGDARAALPPQELVRVLTSLPAAVLGRQGPSAAPGLLDLLRRYEDLAPADAVATVGVALPEAGRGALRDLAAAALRREPGNPALLRLLGEVAVAEGRAVEAHELLTRYARADHGLPVVQRVRKMRGALPRSGGPEARVALLSSFTIDPVAAYLDLECRELGLDPEIYVAPFNTWPREVIDAGSGLRQFWPDIAFLSVALDDLLPELAGALPDDRQRRAGAEAVDRVLEAARRFAEWSDAALVVHGFHSVHRDPLGVLQGRGGPSRAAWIAELNAQLAEGLRALPRAYLLDMQELLANRASGSHDNPKLRHLAGMRLADRVPGEVASAYARYIAPLKGLTRKCVVLDLDNTLWGGIVGEDGVHGIKLGNTSPGSEFREFQSWLLSLTERGILLAVNSKNNPEDALQVIRGHEGMVLREESFSAVRINWDPKPENMRAIARELNIGVDALVFLDDNPKEREMMRQMLPEVLTPEMPTDPALYRRAVESLPQLQTLVVTEEDRGRAEQYRAKRQRDQVRASTGSLDEYLRSLEIAVEIAPASEATLPRIHQLLQRTNQFNLTTRRYDLGELAAFARDPAWRVYDARVVDRFGDHGLVAAALVQTEQDHWRIDSFLMSCRVIGYGVETALLAAVADAARAAGSAALVGEYIETPKNLPARDFYPRHGFRGMGSGGGGQRFERSLAEELPSPAWINRKESHES